MVTSIVNLSSLSRIFDNLSSQTCTQVIRSQMLESKFQVLPYGKHVVLLWALPFGPQETQIALRDTYRTACERTVDSFTKSLISNN